MQPHVSFSTGSPSPEKGRLVAKKPQPARHWAESMGIAAGRWLLEYLSEWQLTDARNARALQGRCDAIVQSIHHSDVVCFVKPGGLCPFCNMASKTLIAASACDAGESSTGERAPRFSLHIADLMNDDREALRLLLDVPVLTWPVIFVRGKHLGGGGEAVVKLDKEGSLLDLISAPRAEFTPRLISPEVLPYPRLLHHAGGGSWFGCQTRIYGNVLRGIALLQIALLLPAHELEKTGNTAAATPLLVILAVDALLFCLCGPTPWTPLGNLSTLIVWPRRGSIAPLLPYKVTFGALYLCVNVVGLACRLVARGTDSTIGGLAVGNATTPTSPSPVCDIVNSDGLVWTMVTNSMMLAIFRF